MGRPSKINTIDLDLVKKYAGLGMVDTEIAQLLGISEVTLNAYKNKPEFLKSLKDGKAISDAKVTDSLYKRANGYEYDEITQEEKKGEMVITKIVTKQVAPDTGACCMWLKNRKAELWRDVKNDNSINITATIIQQVRKALNGRLQEIDATTNR